ncbi:T9SS type A sorting domain-containing protein [Candidatus Eisenbacteria bacterium]|uniref:T9SS type A sorting domain-containing protein n=1 Tax=Eiseniibacteriota bacterium TaxID=2212470 RepID=A0ABV6YL60_UNCEI
MKQIVSIGFILGLAALLCPTAHAVIEMPMNVCSNGGARVGDATYTIHCTLGQPAIGLMGTGSHICENGFWFPTCYYYTDVPEPQDDLTTHFELGHGGPTSFGHVSTIRYAVPKSAHVSIRLYDVTGRIVQTLVDRQVNPGSHEAAIQSVGLGAGVYFCRMRAKGFSATRRLLLVR